MPTVCPSRAKTMAFDFTCFAHLPAEQQRASFGVGRRALRHDFQFRFAQLVAVRLLHEHAAGDALQLQFAAARPRRGISSSRRFFFAANFSSAAGSYPGATMHSTNSFATSSAVAASSARLNASTAAERRNRIAGERLHVRFAQRLLLRRAARIVVLDDRDAAAPQIPTTSAHAASRSTRLLYESSLP